MAAWRSSRPSCFPWIGAAEFSAAYWLVPLKTAAMLGRISMDTDYDPHRTALHRYPRPGTAFWSCRRALPCQPADPVGGSEEAGGRARRADLRAQQKRGAPDARW